MHLTLVFPGEAKLDFLNTPVTYKQEVIIYILSLYLLQTYSVYAWDCHQFLMALLIGSCLQSEISLITQRL